MYDEQSHSTVSYVGMHADPLMETRSECEWRGDAARPRLPTLAACRCCSSAHCPTRRRRRRRSCDEAGQLFLTPPDPRPEERIESHLRLELYAFVISGAGFLGRGRWDREIAWMDAAAGSQQSLARAEPPFLHFSDPSTSDQCHKSILHVQSNQFKVLPTHES